MIDSHVHLFAEPHLETLAWMTADNLLHAPHRLEEYIASSKALDSEVHGLVFIETDRKQTATDWSQPIEEYAYVSRIIESTLLEGEGKVGNRTADVPVVGIIPWAPFPYGVDAVKTFIEELKAASLSSYSYVKGFRYLVQDKPSGVMLTDNFVDCLNFLAEQDLVFDLGIDLHNGGVWQYKEAVQMMRRAPKTTYIINHLGKPDLQIPASEIHLNEKFVEWKSAMREFATYDSYVKLSGGLSELPYRDVYDEAAISAAVEFLFPWVSAVYSIFGPKRVLWGSDWPVCKFGGGQDAMKLWKTITDRLVLKLELSDEDKYWLFDKTSRKAYRL